MKIKSILNNSALIALNDENQELVLIGKGISFQKHPGDRVDTTKIEKEFICGKETTNELMELLNEIPSRYFELTEVIVRHIRRKLNKDIKSSIYISLFDHINSAIERAEDGIFLDFTLLDEFKILYPKEFAVALWALDYINATLDMNLPEDEAGFICIHIISSIPDNPGLPEVKKIAKIVKKLSSLTLEAYQDEIKIESMDYSRYMTHLRYLALRYLRKKQDRDAQQFLSFESKDERMESCIEKMDQYLINMSGYGLSPEEKDYIRLHMFRLIAS